MIQFDEKAFQSWPSRRKFEGKGSLYSVGLFCTWREGILNRNQLGSGLGFGLALQLAAIALCYVR